MARPSTHSIPTERITVEGAMWGLRLADSNSSVANHRQSGGGDGTPAFVLR
jgi:hypothetical protein